MWRLDRRACATLAVVAFAGLAGIASVDALGQSVRQRQECRAPEAGRQAGRREADARRSRRTYQPRTQPVRAAARREAYPARERAVAGYHPNRVAPAIRAPAIERQRLAGGGVTRGAPFAGAGRVSEVSRGVAGGPARVVRYGNTLSGTVERTIRPGLVSRTFVSGGHVLYTHVYQQHVWHQFGRTFAYETFVPGVRFPGVYYAWALAAWPHPVVYSWGWQVQPWYPVYGALFTPYPVYTSPDLWMTDYIIAQNMQAAYQAQTPQPSPGEVPAAPAPYSGYGPPPAQPNYAPPGAPPGYPAPAAPPDYQAPGAQPGNAAPAPQPGDVPAEPQSTGAPPAPPPAITPQIKAQLDAQIKVQLQEQQAAAATPVSLTSQSTPPALRRNHVFFGVVQPLEVPSGTAGGYCSLSPNDYIRRTGGMSDDDWKIPVVVELSGPSDCPQGLKTRIGLNDLNAMENEQEAQVMEAMQAASKGMGPNGPPSGPGAQPTLIAAGNATPDPGALEALRQAQ
jgi:hypothetical protein